MDLPFAMPNTKRSFSKPHAPAEPIAAEPTADDSIIVVCPTGASSSDAAAGVNLSEGGGAAPAESCVKKPRKIDGFPAGFHWMPVSPGSTVMYKVPAMRFRKNVTQEELDKICPGYWLEDSQHESGCKCPSCKIIWDTDFEPSFDDLSDASTD